MTQFPTDAYSGMQDLVVRANDFDETASAGLEDLLHAMPLDTDAASFTRTFRLLAGLEANRLRLEAARRLSLQAGRQPGLKDTLRALAGTEEPGERRLAVLALGFLDAPKEDDLTLLVGALDRPGDEPATSLGRLGRRSTQAADLLISFASRVDLGRCLPGLVLLGDQDGRALELVMRAASDESAALRHAVARALLDADAPAVAALGILDRLLQDARLDTQVLALNGLTRLAATESEAVSRLARLATDIDHRLRLRALRSLAAVCSSSDEARRAVMALIGTQDDMVVMALAMGLGEALIRNRQDSLPLLLEIARRPNEEVLSTVTQILLDVSAAQPGGVAEIVYGLVRAGTGAITLPMLVKREGPAGRLASDVLRLWSGDGDPEVLLIRVLETLTSLDEDGTVVARYYRWLERCVRFATADEILAAAGDIAQLLAVSPVGAPHLSNPLEHLHGMIDRLARFETQTDPEAQSRIIQEALTELDDLIVEYKATPNVPSTTMLAHVLARWKTVLRNTLMAARRGADIVLQLQDRKLQRGAPSSFAILIRNHGPGVARDLKIVLAPSPSLLVHVGSHQIGSLAPHEKQVLPFSFTPAADADHLHVEVGATWSDFAETDRHLSLAEEMLFRDDVAFTPVVNPYIPGLPLDVGSDLFLGREDVFHFVEQNLGRGAQKRIIVLVGQRRMGKTSILKQMPLRLPTDKLPVFVDCQGLEHNGLGNLLYHLSYIILDVLQDAGAKVAVPDLASFQDRPVFTFEYGFIRPAIDALQGKSLMLLIDEFQALDEAVEAGRLDASIYGFLRSLMQHQERLYFLFSGLQKPLEQTRDYWQPVFNITLRKEVGLLDADYARQLIEKPVAGKVHYDPAATDELIRLCCGHPYLTQLFCDRLINHANDIHSNTIRVRHVHDVIGQVFTAGVNHFYSLWEDLSPREKVVLIAISSILATQPYATMSAVARFVRERGIACELDHVTEVLQLLLGHDMIAFVNSQPPGYAFKVTLFRMWIEKEMLQALVGGKIKWQ